MNQQPADLVRFIRNIPVLTDGTVPLNALEAESQFHSELYEPTFALSTIARMTQDVLNSDKLEVVDAELNPSTIVSQALDSDLASFSPSIYMLTRMVTLESFALLYHIEQESENLRYVSTKDIQRSRENINYIADFLGAEPKYHQMIEVLRHMHISFGYLQHQIDVIMKSRGVR